MANSFNISVKPEIAALETKVDTIDTVVDLIRSTDVVNIQTNIDANETKIDTIDTVVDLIRGTDVVNLASAIANNAEAIEVIDGIVDAIKIKTDATPQNVRGRHLQTTFNTTENTLQTALSVTGHGFLDYLAFRVRDVTDTVALKVTVDGVPTSEASFTGDLGILHIVPATTIASPYLQLNLEVINAANYYRFDFEFDRSLLVELRRSAGTALAVDCYIFYHVDDF